MRDTPSLAELSLVLRQHQLRLKYGEKLVSMSEIARRACLDRSVIYDAANEKRVSVKSQIRLGLVMSRVASEAPVTTTSARVWHVDLKQPQAGLRRGIGPLGGCGKR